MPSASTMPTASALPTAPNGPTGQLATWIAGFTLDQAPPEVQQRAKYLLLDGFGCALVGAQLPWSRTAVQTVIAFEGKGDTPIIGWGATTGPAAAALLNATLIRAMELDPGHPVCYVHSTCDVIGPMLSLAHLDPTISGARFVGAAIAGYESGPRAALGLHGGPAMLTRGWHPDPVFGNIPTAAASANILGLDPAQVEDALGHGCTQSFGLMATQYGAMSQRMLAGWSSRNGLYAGLLAKAGYTGIKQVFELSYGGWLSTFGEGHNPDSTQIASELGKRWETLREAVKPYACNGAADAAIDALFDINAKRHLKAAEIASIDFDFTTPGYKHSVWPIERPITMTTAQCNIAYVAAVAVLDGEVLVKQFTPSRINSDDVWDLIPRINSHIDPDFDKDTDPSHAFQSRARIRFTDGTELDSYQVAARAAQTPLSNDEIVTKFRNVTDGIIDTDRRARIEETILNLDKQSSLKGLVELLAPPVKSPFET
jgi:2-methylcitrate dehydratase PrpD